MMYDLTIESSVKITVTDPSWLHVYFIPHNSYMNGLHAKVIINPTAIFVMLSSMLCFFDCMFYSWSLLCIAAVLNVISPLTVPFKLSFLISRSNPT
jgi:hypothetical protein